MFEQSTLPRGSTLKRFLTTSLGMTGQAVLVGCMLLAPMLWPQILPKATVMMMIAPPGPPPPPPPKGTVRPRHTPTTARVFRMPGLLAPSFIPREIRTDPDPPAEPPEYRGPGGVVGGMEGGVVGSSLIGGIVGAGTPPPIAQPEPARTTNAPTPVVTQPRIIRVSQGVQMGRLVHRVEPIYPQIARTARVSGSVQLVGIIGTNGHLREVRLVSGPALLAKAAIDAVSQWIYAPTLLSGEPVEVEAPITVTFILN